MAGASSASERDDTWLCGSSSENGCVFRCRWVECTALLSCTADLQHHILNDHCAIELQSGEWSCGVIGCDAVLIDEDHARRHMLFHCFHADRQQRGREVLVGSSYTKQMTDCGHTTSSGLVFDGSPLVCEWDTCMVAFDDMFDFVQHCDEHMTALGQEDCVNNVFICRWSNCEQTIRNKNNLRWHIRHHSGDKPVACPFCGRFFANGTKLVDHVIRKIENGRLKCFLCQKTFLTERLLREHGRRHVKNYKCPFCDMTVETPSDLRDHISKRHSNSRPHQCEKCPKAFHQKSDLDRHMVVHEDRYPFECEFCPQSFKWKRQLNMHVRLHDKNADPYTHLCHLCPTKFKNGSNLSKHLIRKHQLSVPSGHSRFQYKKCADGYLRLQTERYESEKLAAQIEAIQRGEKSALVVNSDNHTSTWITIDG